MELFSFLKTSVFLWFLSLILFLTLALDKLPNSEYFLIICKILIWINSFVYVFYNIPHQIPHCIFLNNLLHQVLILCECIFYIDCSFEHFGYKHLNIYRMVHKEPPFWFFLVLLVLLLLKIFGEFLLKKYLTSKDHRMLYRIFRYFLMRTHKMNEQKHNKR